ncbi:hypothetical protein HC891_11530 [Candidatus Gracilibacteria bacterium]|nr:hypothetical protein [Candidatus Gracilibacteria bacterium]
MNRWLKLTLDILMGAVIPIAVLNYLSGPLGEVPAYLVSALIPVAWVFIDLLFITKRFNVITSYIGLTAIVRGLLAFWFVDGFWFAVKDSVGFVVGLVVFGGSILLRRPLAGEFVAQALNPDTPQRSAQLASYFKEPRVRRALVQGTLLMLVVNVVLGIINFWLNLQIVVAPFGTEAFNQQVAQVNAITRLALGIPDFLVTGFAMYRIFSALYQGLPTEEGKSPWESEFWDLMRLRDEQAGAV